ncbi:hypothetical protein PPERSA_08232 [Pseudocohnilembus persalinus]|uniref:Uncharacterized protein n=1 Tax=Pseudocohnilembus persalinus TaxID=266149 RepID=A0A0V0QG00_PSEPJ|nr:hypothetical protein PPERSA_08232 [Pseudocohnilembus persalinus]|eukprot:KRX01131.1 hypothetical protein PPERSA_08232 [Pseudocohnilembus persalinus]
MREQEDKNKGNILYHLKLQQNENNIQQMKKENKSDSIITLESNVNNQQKEQQQNIKSEKDKIIIDQKLEQNNVNNPIQNIKNEFVKYNQNQQKVSENQYDHLLKMLQSRNHKENLIQSNE